MREIGTATATLATHRLGCGLDQGHGGEFRGEVGGHACGDGGLGTRVGDEEDGSRSNASLHLVDQRGKILARDAGKHLSNEPDTVDFLGFRPCGLATHGNLAAQLRDLVRQGLAFIEKRADAVGEFSCGGLDDGRNVVQPRILLAQVVKCRLPGQRLDPADTCA